MTDELTLYKLQPGETFVDEKEFNEVSEALDYFRNSHLLLHHLRELEVDDEGRGIDFEMSINHTAPYRVVITVKKES